MRASLLAIFFVGTTQQFTVLTERINERLEGNNHDITQTLSAWLQSDPAFKTTPKMALPTLRKSILHHRS